jgi:hypothetical protein
VCRCEEGSDLKEILPRIHRTGEFVVFVLLVLLLCVGVGEASVEKRGAAGMFAFGKEQPKKVQSVLSAVEALDAALRGLPADLIPDFEKAAQELFDHHRTRDEVSACSVRTTGGCWFQERAGTC